MTLAVSPESFPAKSTKNAGEYCGGISLPERTLAPDTPTHSIQPFLSFVEPAFVEGAKQLEGKFTAVSPKKFLEKHLSIHPPGMPQVDYTSFKKVSAQKREATMYQPLVCLFVVSSEWTSY